MSHGRDVLECAKLQSDTISSSRKRGLRVTYARTEKEFAERTARHLKAEQKGANVTDEALATRLREHGFDETTTSIAKNSHAPQ
jgi:hypothetical protein